MCFCREVISAFYFQQLITCDTLVAVEDIFEPIFGLLSAGVKGVAAETVPNKGKQGILVIWALENTLVSLSPTVECCLCSDNLPKYQPLRPTLVRVVRLNAIRLALFIFFRYFVITAFARIKKNATCTTGRR